MSASRYLLLGWKPRTSKQYAKTSLRQKVDRMRPNISVVPLVKGDARAVIKAACAAQCGVTLVDLADVKAVR